MKRVPAVLWFAIRGVYDGLFPLAGMGLIWFAVAAVLPLSIAQLVSTYLAGNVALGIILILISLIPAPPITAAVYYVTSFIAREKRIEFNYFWQGLKTYYWRSWVVAGILLAIGAVVIFAVYFYLNTPGTFFKVLAFLGIWALALWLAIQIYLFPLMVHQEDKRLQIMFKNGALLSLAYPGFALGILIGLLLVTALSGLTIILLPTLWMPLVALINSRALVSSLGEVEQYQKAQEELDQEEEAED